MIMHTNHDLEAQRQLIASLQKLLQQDNPSSTIEIIETHISWVVLTTSYVYKIKKAVDFGFLNFTTLAQREFYCHEELRLNRRLAPHYYVDVIPILGTAEHPYFDGTGPVLEFALRLRRFPPHRLLSEISTGEYGHQSTFTLLAQRLAEFHLAAAHADSTADFGSPESVFGPASDNIATLLSRVILAGPQRQLGLLKDWQQTWMARHRVHLVQRKQQGWIREGHGDLHFGNIAVAENELIIFDCIEFNPALRWIDVCCDYGFLIMDCLFRDRRAEAAIFLNQYLEITGDYSGVALLQFYLVYRALVRAKVNAIRAQQTGSDEAWNDAYAYIALADRVVHDSHPFIVMTCGVSGSGKSYLSQQLVAALWAPRLRSDVERKRLFALNALDRTDTKTRTLLYAQDSTVKTYARLHDSAASVLAGGVSIIVDATFLRRHQRAPFLDLARSSGAPCVIVHTTASTATLQARVRQRCEANNDPSDADLKVLEAQQRDWEPLSAPEQHHVIEVDTNKPIDVTKLADDIRLRLTRSMSSF